MKCSACEEKVCERKYANRGCCLGVKEDIKCLCTCHVHAFEEIATSVLSFGVGATAIAGGVALTFFTGGIAVLGGGALMGIGSKMMMNPIQKKISGEHMTLKGSTVGVITAATSGEINYDFSELFFTFLFRLNWRCFGSHQ
jgi:hypothetical protein